MPDIVFVVAVEEIGEDLVAGKRPGRHRRHEAAGALGHHHPHGCTALAQAADQVEALVSGDAAADHEKDARVSKAQRCLPLAGWRTSAGGRRQLPEPKERGAGEMTREPLPVTS